MKLMKRFCKNIQIVEDEIVVKGNAVIERLW